MHDAYTIGIPTSVIVLGILLNRSEVRELRAEMRAEIAGIRTDITNLRDEFHREFREFYRTLG
ncbi:hypothetical protein [Silvibacterium sp.]|uniref:hypothetical protein n=1 Tax=Silvibacterium sp. TaxID=1964179 RepID=UPI0039E4590F